MMPRWYLWAALAAVPLAIWASIAVPEQYLVPVVAAMLFVGKRLWKKYPLPPAE